MKTVVKQLQEKGMIINDEEMVIEFITYKTTWNMMKRSNKIISDKITKNGIKKYNKLNF